MIDCVPDNLMEIPMAEDNNVTTMGKCPYQDRELNRAMADIIILHGSFNLLETTMTSTLVCHQRPLRRTKHHPNNDQMVENCSHCQNAKRKGIKIYQQLIV